MNAKTDADAHLPINGLVKWLTIVNYVIITSFLLLALVYATLSASDLATGGKGPLDKNMVALFSVAAAVLVGIELVYIRARKRAAIIVFAVVSALLLPLQEVIFYFMNQPFSVTERVIYYPLTAFLLVYILTNQRIKATFTR